MDRNLENSDATSVRRKTRSLDPRGFCKSSSINGNLNYSAKRHFPYASVDTTRPLKRRNSRKEVSLIRRRKNTRNSNLLYSGDGVGSALSSFDKTHLTSPISRSLNENAVSVPRRQRGCTGRKKTEACSLPNLSETRLPITHNETVSKKRSRLFSDMDVVPSGTKRNWGSDCIKDSFGSSMNKRSSREEENTSSRYDADLCPTRVCTNVNRSRNSCAIKSQEALSCQVDSLAKISHTFQDDDDENLEHNAARMLCSRFNPTRTRSNANRKLSSVPPNFFTSPFQKFVDCDVASPIVSELGSLDGVGMVLRPRKQHVNRVMSRKRRHFYELLLKDLDANWMLHRRIQVFWQLDQKWHFGLVDGYDLESKLHLVKYDGRDDEWVNLENERFKLLLLPSEVPESTGMKNHLADGRSENDENKSIIDDSNTKNFLDSEPIISWISRSTRNVKSTQSCLLKNEEISRLPLSSELSTERCAIFECMDTCYTDECCNKPLHSSIIRERSTDVCEKYENQRIFFSKNEKVSLVYYRRRKHKRRHIHHRICDNICIRTPRIFSPFIRRVCNKKKSNGCWRKENFCKLSCIATGVGYHKLSIPLIKSHQCSFEGQLSELILGHPYEETEVLFTGDLFMLKCGMIVANWPLVQLEIYFMGDTSGLNLFQFDVCIKQVASALSLIYNSFHESNKGSLVHSHTSIAPFELKFSCNNDTKNPLLFLFYNFSKLKKFMWSYMYKKLTKYHPSRRQFPLSECVPGIIRALQSDYPGLIISSVAEEASVFMVPQNMNCQSETFTKVSTNPLYVDKKHGTVSSFSIPFTAPPPFFPGRHLKCISESNISDFRLQYRVPLSLGENDGMFSCLNLAGCSVSGCYSGDGNKMDSNLNLPPNVAASYGFFSIPQTETGNDICLLNDLPSIGISLIQSVFIQAESSSIIQAQKQKCCEHYLPENGVYLGAHSVKRSFELFWKSSVMFGHTNPIAPIVFYSGCRCNTVSYSGSVPCAWPDGKADNFCGFGNRTKKPRTQVSYMTPFKSQDGNSPKNLQYRGVCHKKIRTTSDNKAIDLSGRNEKKQGLLSCNANILITAMDRGWRECGAHVVLEFVDHTEWKIAVKLMGAMRYSYKAHQFLQPAMTNRYTHDLLWKGGKDWILEFPKRDQWAHFKEIYAECYNRNFHAAVVKNIPIPGVFLKEEGDDDGPEVSFVRDSSFYFRQSENDVEMALNPSRVLYDMDSDDEQWMLINCSASDGSKCSLEELKKDMFEKAIDMFEKTCFTEKNDRFTDDELRNVCAGIGSFDDVKVIYEYWHQKRKRKGMPLIRQFQPPLWKRYHEQVTEWELATGKSNPLADSSGSSSLPEKGGAEKPPMFAFCLKPRGLEAPPNKCSRQRSYKKFPISGKHINSGSFGGGEDQEDAFHPTGGRSLNPILGFRCSNRWPDPSPPLGIRSFKRDHTSGRIFYPRFQRSRSMKVRARLRTDGSVDRSPAEFSGSEYALDKAEFEELRLRQALFSAQQALLMAKLKREKAQRLLYRADLAVHRAVDALMVAEVINGSS